MVVEQIGFAVPPVGDQRADDAGCQNLKKCQVWISASRRALPLTRGEITLRTLQQPLNTLGRTSSTEQLALRVVK